MSGPSWAAFVSGDGLLRMKSCSSLCSSQTQNRYCGLHLLYQKNMLHNLGNEKYLCSSFLFLKTNGLIKRFPNVLSYKIFFLVSAIFTSIFKNSTHPVSGTLWVFFRDTIFTLCTIMLFSVCMHLKCILETSLYFQYCWFYDK